jgi:hypothetical protein
VQNKRVGAVLAAGYLGLLLGLIQIPSLIQYWEEDRKGGSLLPPELEALLVAAMVVTGLLALIPPHRRWPAVFVFAAFFTIRASEAVTLALDYSLSLALAALPSLMSSATVVAICSQSAMSALRRAA